jgi:hypothetical protein
MALSVLLRRILGPRLLCLPCSLCCSLKDVGLVHSEHDPYPNQFGPNIELVVTAIRTDMVTLVARNASLTVLVPDPLVCPGRAGANVAGATSGHSIVEVVASAVAIPVAVALCALGAVLWYRRRTRQTGESDSAGGSTGVEMTRQVEASVAAST